MPTTTSNVHMPIEKTNRYRKPSVALFVAVTHVNTAAITGAEHGAATSPDIAPMMNAPEARPAVPAVAARSRITDGTRNGIPSNMGRAATSTRVGIAKYT